MAKTAISYEHPPGSGTVGCVRPFDDDWILASNRGPLRAADVEVGDCLQTTPTHKSRVLLVEPVVEE